LGVRTTADAVGALKAGDSVLVDIARAGQTSFVNTASTGIYVDLVRARPDLADGQLDVRMVDGSQPFARARLIAAVAMGTLARSRVYRTWTASSLRIATPDGSPVLLSVDGEALE